MHTNGENHDQFMKQALELAEKGSTSNGPMANVGCVIVKEGRVIGEGFHTKAGEDHAEVAALKSCSEDPEGSLVYVTLEPCSHHGKTPPCVDALIQAKVKEVIFACTDPNKLVDGIKVLKNAGISVAGGILEKEAQDVNKHFFKYITTGTPFIYLKAAITLDGKIATHSYSSKWISCEQSREKVHFLRQKVDGVLVGKNTVLKDDPRLNARLETVSYPTRIVIDKDDDLDNKFKIFNQEGKTIIVTSVDKGKDNRIICNLKNGKMDLNEILQKLAEKGIMSILVEGGGEVFTQFIKQKLVDEFQFFVTPKILGNDGIGFMGKQELDSIKDSVQLNFNEVQRCGTDILITGGYADE